MRHPETDEPRARAAASTPASTEEGATQRGWPPREGGPVTFRLGSFRLGSLMVAALVAALLAGMTALAAESTARAADTPPGAQISDSLEYVGRVPDSSMIVEGKFDTVAGRDVLVTTGRYGFRTYDVGNPAAPRLLDAFQPPEILGANGYWQDEDMELDVRRKLIIGALDPRHDNVDQASCPGIGALGAKTRNPGCRSGATISPTSGRSPRAAAGTAGRSGSPTSRMRHIQRPSRSRSTCGATTG
jgi:hypothetical protein